MDEREEHPSDRVLVSYLKGELARESEVDALETHTRSCNHCKVVLAALRALIDYGKGKPAPSCLRAYPLSNA